MSHQRDCAAKQTKIKNRARMRTLSTIAFLVIIAIAYCNTNTELELVVQSSSSTVSRVNNITDFAQFSWFNPPTSFELTKDNKELTVQTTPKSDYWRKIFYGFIHNDGNFYYTAVRNDINFTMNVRFEAEYRELYDQGGLMIRFDDQYWLKTGIEYVEGKLQVSAVYTNDKSDWSVVSLDKLLNKQKKNKKQQKKKDKKKKTKQALFIQVRRLADTFIAEYKLKESDEYTMIRLGYLSPEQQYETVQVGVMACSPIAETVRVKFSKFNFFQQDQSSEGQH